MANENWRPLSVREGLSDDAKFDALHPGIPQWLFPSLNAWFEDYEEDCPQGYDLDSVVHFAERSLRRSFGGDWHTAQRVDEEDLLDLIDFLVTFAFQYFDRVAAQPHVDEKGQPATVGEGLVRQLERILEESGSMWMVSFEGGSASLRRRVQQEVMESAQRTMSPNDRASHHLKEAWNDIFGRDPDPSDGYLQAVKAVEAVAQPIISPNDSKATLGKMIPAMRAKPSKWNVSLEHVDPEEQVRQVVGMMELLWKGQHDRHGKADEEAPFNVSQEEAEAAVHLAVTLVQWFRSGTIS